MELIETRTGLTVIFILALALFFLRQYAHNPFKQTLQKASRGDPEAQYQMGLMYYQGKRYFKITDKPLIGWILRQKTVIRAQ